MLICRAWIQTDLSCCPWGCWCWAGRRRSSVWRAGLWLPGRCSTAPWSAWRPGTVSEEGRGLSDWQRNSLVKITMFFPSCVCVYLLGVGAGVQARHQVEDVAERHWVQVFDEWGEEVVDVTATVFQLKHQTRSRINYFIFEQKRDVFVLKSAVWDLNIWINVCSNITFVTASDGTWAS